jgi:hypothetical protein
MIVYLYLLYGFGCELVYDYIFDYGECNDDIYCFLCIAGSKTTDSRCIT